MRNRNDESQMTAEELFIVNALRAVESIPAADTRLTNAIYKLSQAKQHLGNYIDGIAEEGPKEPSKEETFLDRLIKEEQELDKKINGLTKSLDSSEFAIKVGPYQFQLLHIQHSAMMAYSWTLKMRIGDLKKK